MAKPLLNIHCICRNGCDYPVAVRIAMDDGTVQTYALENAVSPAFQRAKEILEESIEISVGYRFVPKQKRKRRIHRGQL